MTIDTSGPVLYARGLTKQYGMASVLDGLTWELEAGTVVGLVGRNGAGKSTLLGCLLGLHRADGGEAGLFGHPPDRIDDAGKASLGYVPQRLDGFEWMTVGAMLDMVRGMYPQWDAQRVSRLLDAWDLAPDRRISALSPGQRQQVAIVRALGPRPQLLVLDEPMSALDPVARRTLLREIADLAAQDGCTVLFSTHIVSDLERVASHVALLHGGRIRLHAEIDDVKESMRRVSWPAGLALPSQPLPTELSRRVLEGGGACLVLREPARAALPPGALVHPLSLEDLFVELTA